MYLPRRDSGVFRPTSYLFLFLPLINLSFVKNLLELLIILLFDYETFLIVLSWRPFRLVLSFFLPWV